ncbi:rhamnan synthesis F family protein [Methylobacterium durans]|nr:rhamnan synthesis F family protein [Methylobacterium durans]
MEYAMRVNFFRARARLKRSKSIVRKSILFDSAYYAQVYGLSRHIDAAEHFCKIGWKKGFNPSRFFDVNFYLSAYEDVRKVGANPLVHYLTEGAQEFRWPVKDFDVAAFCAAHAELDPRTQNPAEFCVEKYGGYDWTQEQYRSVVLPEDVVHAFKSRFDPDFYRSMNIDTCEAGEDPYYHFINRGQYEDRDPAPEFDIGFYRSKIRSTDELLGNPIFHYVRQGRPQGAATQPADAINLDTRTISPATHDLKICVHAHCYYPELLSEVLPGFANLPATAKVVITTCSEPDKEFIQKRLSREAFPQAVEVRQVPNRGRDLGPFLIGCRDIWRDFDIVVHVHTKVSPHIRWGKHWREYLLDQTFGSEGLVNDVLSRFQAEADLGCLYPRNFCKIRRFTQKEGNTSVIEAMMQRLGYGRETLQQSDYPAGSMAWYRTSALTALTESIDSYDQFEEEARQLDFTFAHALERILPLVVRASGYRVCSYTTSRRSRLIPRADFPARENTYMDIPDRWIGDTPNIARHPVLPTAPASRVYNERCLNIHWIIPSFNARGAGGHMSIFRMVEFLERFGHHQTLWLQSAIDFSDQAEARSRAQQWYRPIGQNVHVRFLPEDIRQLSGDALIATERWSAFPASLAVNFKERFYFVQDFEPSFYPAGELQILTEATYDFGFAALCAGPWLGQLMRERGLWTRCWDLCAEHEVYYPGIRPPVGERPIRIAFYARPYTPRRAVGLGFAAFEILHRRGVNFHVELFGEANLEAEFDFAHTQHGVLTHEELSDLYRNSDIGVVFSSTNYSLIPLEMMACDLPVVEIDVPSTRAVFKNDEVYFASPTPYGIADAIEALLNDKDRQAQQRERGRAFVERTSWERSARAVESAIRERIAELGYTALSPEPFPAPVVVDKPKATVLIPTYNAGASFAQVLDQVTRQACDFAYDILIIDSESTDGTYDLAKGYADRGVRIERIPKAEFQHGRTRNLGIERSEGAYVALITQDACPRNSHWLQHLIGGFSRGPRVAGVIGRHEAYPEHDAFTRRDMTEMFDGLALLPDVIDRDNGLPSYIYPGGQTWQMLMHFYSDNNSAMSREAWKVLSYPEIEWGEDQVWANEMLKLGFQKAYVNEAVVYHSHKFDLKTQYKTSMTEGKFWAEQFGINLHPDPEAAIAAMNARDQAFAICHSIDADALEQRRLFNRAIVEGRSAGYRAAPLFEMPSGSGVTRTTAIISNGWLRLMLDREHFYKYTGWFT